MSMLLLEKLRNRPEEVRDMLRRRRLDESLVDKFNELDERWRAAKRRLDEARHKHNLVSRRVPRAAPGERDALIAEAKRLNDEIRALEEEANALERAREEVLWSFPNLVHESVPTCPEGIDSVPVRFGGPPPMVYEGHLDQFMRQTGGFDVAHRVVGRRPVGHADLLENVLGMGDTAKAGEVAGSRFYYVFDDIVWLDFALSLYALDVLTRKGFRPVIPPYMLKTDIIRRVADYNTLRDAIYRVENDDLALIGTAEHALAAYLYKRELLEDDLPILLVGWSPCFRREAGAGSRDLKGIFRVHVFHKVEQFVFALPEDSWRWLEDITRNTEEIIGGLGLPYRVVNLCAHDLGAPSAKTYDIEIWMPAQGLYREMASCSNVLDWQSYKLGVRVTRRDMSRQYVHTLNCTGLATTRTITAILENYQREDGYVEVPKALRGYLEAFPNAPHDYISPRNVR